MRRHRMIYLLIALFLLGLGMQGSVLGQDGSLEGVEITVLIHPTLYGAHGGEDGIFADFEEATGATVRVDLAPIPEHTEKALVEFIAQRPTYDVIAMQSADMQDVFLQYLLPMDDYLEQDADEMQWDDFLEAMRDWGWKNDQQLGVPFRAGTQMLYYRTDLFEEAGLEVPETQEELYAAAEALTMDTDGDGEIDVYGLVQRGKAPTEIAHDWLTTFYGAGGEFLTEEGMCGFDSDAGISATELWVDLYQNDIYPPDVFAWGRDDYITAMQQGRAAMGIYVSSYIGRLLDPEESTVAEHIGWALPPTAEGVPAGRSRTGGWLFTISQFSENPDASWEFIKYVTSVENHMRSAVEYGNGPVRASSFESEDYIEQYPMALDWSVGTGNSATDPAIPEHDRILDQLSVELVAAMQGDKTPEQAMQDACTQANDFLGF